MRLYGVALLICFLGKIVSVQGSTQDTHFSMHSVQAIQDRYYLIKRLEHPMNALFKGYELIAHEKTDVLKFTKRLRQAFTVTHPAVVRALVATEASASLTPFKKMWCDFLSYRYVHDDVFVYEAIKIFLILYKEIVQAMARSTASGPRIGSVAQVLVVLTTWGKQVTRAFKGNGLEYGKQDLCNLLVQGNYTAECLCPQVHRETIKDHVTTVENIFKERTHTSSVIDTILRFYHLQRLVQPIYVLSSLLQASAKKTVVCQLPSNTLSHGVVNACSNAIQKQKTLQPFFALWKRLATYDYIDDHLLLEDFVRLIIVLYHDLGSRELIVTSDTLHKPAVSDITHVYEQISALPLAELMTLLDKIADEYEIILEEYALTHTTMSWSTWLSRYWWLAPTTIVSLGICLLKWHYQKLITTQGA